MLLLRNGSQPIFDMKAWVEPRPLHPGDGKHRCGSASKIKIPDTYFPFSCLSKVVSSTLYGDPFWPKTAAAAAVGGMTCERKKGAAVKGKPERHRRLPGHNPKPSCKRLHNSSENAYFSAPVLLALSLSFAFITLLSSPELLAGGLSSALLLLATCVPVRQRGRRVRVGGGARGRRDLPGDFYFRTHGPAH